MFKLNIFYLILGAFIGFMVSYITSPKPEVIVKEPTLDNAGKVTYLDEKNMCYRYRPERVTCQSGRMPTPVLRGDKHDEVKTFEVKTSESAQLVDLDIGTGEQLDGYHFDRLPGFNDLYYVNP